MRATVKLALDEVHALRRFIFDASDRGVPVTDPVRDFYSLLRDARESLTCTNEGCSKPRARRDGSCARCASYRYRHGRLPAMDEIIELNRAEERRL